jgi:OmpA-OmpF porin, OOP family
MNSSAITILALVAATTFALPTLADDSSLSAEELAAKFTAQQATRGLVIAPSNTEGTATADGTAAPLPEDTTYVALDPAAQVNFEIKFAFDSAALEPSEVSKLDTLCEVLKSSDIAQFKIIGHTDASGTDSYNQNLSLLRAEEVKRHLVEDCSVPEAKLLAEGVGEAFPMDPNDPRADVNRRVEFQVGS